MKRLILSVAILVVAASCSKNEVTEIAPSLQNEIGFSTLNDRVTSKAANDDDADFRLFAHMQNSTVDAWFIDDYVQHRADIDEKAYAPVGGPYYWPADGIYDDIVFYAYAPYNTGSTATNNVTETTAEVTGNEAVDITLTYTVPTTADEDFTVAAPVTAEYDSDSAVYQKKDTSTSVENNVPLVFSHMLSKVTFVVKLDDGEGGTMVNYYISENEATEPAPVTDYNDNDALPTIDFTVAYNQIQVDADATVPATIIDKTVSTVDVEGDTTSTYSNATSYMIAPQDVAGCTIQIKGISIRIKNIHNSIFGNAAAADLAQIVLAGTEVTTIDDDDFAATGTNTDKEAFLPGYHYIFTITIYNDAKDDEDDPILGAEIKATATDGEWSEANISLDQGNND